MRNIPPTWKVDLNRSNYHKNATLTELETKQKKLRQNTRNEVEEEMRKINEEIQEIACVLNLNIITSGKIF